METRPDQAGLLGLDDAADRLAGVPRPRRDEPTATTGSTRSAHRSSAGSTSAHVQGHLWGVPADPIHNPERFIVPLSSVGACYREYFETEGCPPGCSFVSPTFAKSTIPPAPFLQNPTDLRRAARGPRRHRILRRLQSRSGVGAVPDDHGLRPAQLQPEHLGEADHRQADTASGLDTDLKVPQPQSPTTPSPSEIRTTTVTLPEGFTHQSRTPPTARSPAPTPTRRSAPCSPPTARSSPRSARRSSTVAALPAPIPGAIYIGEPKPGDPYRIILTADGFATHVKLVGSRRTGPADGPGDDHLRRPSADAAAGVRPARLRLRARPLRDARAAAAPTRSTANSCPGTRRSTTSKAHRLHDVDSGAERRRLPRRRPAAVQPDADGRHRQHDGGQRTRRSASR